MTEGQLAKLLSPEDFRLINEQILGGFRKPDLTIAPDGAPYLYRWELVRCPEANTYLHMQVASDPERPLHDHPWDNTSILLSGGYVERMYPFSPTCGARAVDAMAYTYKRKKGDVVYRKADWPHRLFLPRELKYTLSLFTTGPKIRQWGFWTRRGWVINYDLIETLADGRSVFKGAMTDEED